MNEKFDDFKFVRRIGSLNLWIQIVLGVVLFSGLNYVAARHYAKWDLSENMRNSLSPESAAYLKRLSAPVDVYVVTSGGGSDLAETKRNMDLILRQYEYASSAKAPVRAHFVNSDMESRRAETLASRFGDNLENSVIVASGKNFKSIPLTDFYEMENGERTRFAGERLLSSAILSVSKGTQNKIYFLRGHGEMDFRSSNASNGLSEFASMLAARNYALAPLDLNVDMQIPSDAGMVVIAAPQSSLLPREADLLRKYLLKSNGRVVVLLSMGSLRGLEDILYEWGLMSDDALVLDTSGDYEASGGDLIARSFPQKVHPAAKYLVDFATPVQFGSVRPVRPDLGSPIDASLKLEPLILSGVSSWLEKSYKNGGTQKYDEQDDLKGPLPLAMVASRSGGSELGLKIPGGKIAVFGDENFVSNRRINRLGNAKLAVNLVNWMFDDTDTLNIQPRALQSFALTMGKNDAFSLALRFMVLPFAIFALGIAVFVVRRN